jgi:hypothetical protein
MIRIPRDIDAELQSMKQQVKKLKARRSNQLGELVQSTGADTLPMEALAGALLAMVDRARQEQDAVRRWSERGTAFFRDGARGGKVRATDTASGSASQLAPGNDGSAQAATGERREDGQGAGKSG